MSSCYSVVGDRWVVCFYDRKRILVIEVVSVKFNYWVVRVGFKGYILIFRFYLNYFFGVVVEMRIVFCFEVSYLIRF